MIVTDLIKHEWMKGVRAQGFYKNLAVNILLGFFAMYIAAVLLFIGFSLDNILESAHEKLNPMELFNGALLYILLGGLTFRFFMQQLNTINLPPYQVLPVRRSLLVNFLLVKPLFSPINYFQLFITIPFVIESVRGYYSGPVAFRFVLMTILLVWFNSLTTSFLKRRFGSGFVTFLIVIAGVACLAALEYFGVFSFFDYSRRFFCFVVLSSFGLAIPAIGVALAYFLNRAFFSQNYYAEKFNSKIKVEKNVSAGFSFLNRFGVTGELMSLELKLILRHKRTKSILYMSSFFLLYGLLFYSQDIYKDNNGFLFFVAMFVTGLLMFMFGQWIISWDSNHFDSLMTRNIPIKTYMQANYFLLIAFNVICFVITTPYFFFGMRIVYMHLAAFVFNTGMNVYLLLFLTTYNTKRIDLTKSSAMNYQGTTFKSFLIIFPIMFLPMIIVGVLASLFSMTVALWTLTAIGAAGILMHRQLLNICVNQFNRRKYALAEGFRQSE